MGLVTVLGVLLKEFNPLNNKIFIIHVFHSIDTVKFEELNDLLKFFCTGKKKIYH